MTIQKTEIKFRGRIYEVILEDGLVSCIDPKNPDTILLAEQPGDLKITTIEGAKRMALQMIERIPDPLMTFSD